MKKYWKNPEAARKKVRKHRSKNREEINRRSREAHARNPEPRRRATKNCRLRKGLIRARAEAREYRNKNLDKWRKYASVWNKTHMSPKAHNLKKRFGLTLEDYAKMLEAQNGVCAICKTPPASNRRLAVDHCHTTRRIRQLLCTKCNTALGLLKRLGRTCPSRRRLSSLPRLTIALS